MSNHQELEVEVGKQGSPESPQPSPRSPPPFFQWTLGDAYNFMGFYTADALDELNYWAKRSRNLRRVLAAFAEEPDISNNLKLFLKYELRPQWQFKLLP